MSNPFNVESGVLGSNGGESSDVSASGVVPRRRLRVSKPVLLAVGVVLVVVAGVVGYLVFGYKSTVTEVNTTAKNAEIPLLERYSTANQFLPEKLLAVMQKCNGKADEYNKQITVPVYKCSVAYDEKQILSGAQIRWVPGADALPGMSWSRVRPLAPRMRRRSPGRQSGRPVVLSRRLA